ncbi:MAG: hypothetical protein ACPG77_18470, partial [Nannocystaceae bacterium]
MAVQDNMAVQAPRTSPRFEHGGSILPVMTHNFEAQCFELAFQPCRAGVVITIAGARAKRDQFIEQSPYL